MNSLSLRDIAHGVLRIVTGFLFFLHGAQKMFGWMDGQTGAHSFDLMSRMGLAGVLEVFGGILIILGLFTRPVAFVLAGQMAVAYFLVHAGQHFSPLVNRGEAAVLFCFIYLFFAAAGGGAFSLDRWLRGRRNADDVPAYRR